MMDIYIALTEYYGPKHCRNYNTNLPRCLHGAPWKPETGKGMDGESLIFLELFSQERGFKTSRECIWESF